MQRPNFKRVTFIISSSLLAVFLIISLQFGWINQLIAQITNPNIGAAKPPVQMDDYTKSLNNALTSTYDAVSPTIVSIIVTTEVPQNQFHNFNDFYDFFGFFNDRGNRGEEFKQETPELRKGSGSGVIVSQDGYIVTNYHVVHNATEDGISITTWDKKEYPAKLIGADSLADLAVIKIEESNLTPAHFGNVDSLKPGQIVVALGSPMGLHNTMTQGIISALGRDHFEMGGYGGAYSIESYIQTDAAINPGNSGGGLFNLNGSLIGVNTLIATTNGGFQGYGFAIPIDIVETTVADLISTGKVNRGYMGAAVVNLDDKFAKHLGLEKVEGVLIQDVNTDSPAEKAGIKAADVILEINGKSISSVAGLRSALSGYRVNDEIKVTLWRDKKTITKTVKLGTSGEANEVSDNVSEKEEDNSTNKSVTFEKYGFTVEPLTKEQKKAYETTNGIYIKNVKRYSVAEERRLIQGWIILKVDHKDIETTGQLKKIIESKKQGETILLSLRSPNGNNYMSVLEIL